MHNIWVNNMLDSLTEFLRAHPNDSLDKFAPKFHVSPVFMFLASAFEKMFSLCSNYPKGICKVFLQWIVDNNSGEILFHVERAEYGGQQDVASMAVMAIFWNRKYCFEFLGEMIIYFVKSKKSLHAI